MATGQVPGCVSHSGSHVAQPQTARENVKVAGRMHQSPAEHGPAVSFHRCAQILFSLQFDSRLPILPAHASEPSPAHFHSHAMIISGNTFRICVLAQSEGCLDAPGQRTDRSSAKAQHPRCERLDTAPVKSSRTQLGHWIAKAQEEQPNLRPPFEQLECDLPSRRLASLNSTPNSIEVPVVGNLRYL